MEEEDCSVATLFEQSQKAMYVKAAEKKIHLSYAQSQGFFIRGNMEQLLIMLNNLIDNAIKFSSNSSVIYIQAYPRYEKIFVSVKDTGIGIPKESIKKIWDRFYKSDLSRGKDKSGTGLGLCIVREIIQSHGENIDVISTEGVGSEFIFSLPRVSP